MKQDGRAHAAALPGMVAERANEHTRGVRRMKVGIVGLGKLGMPVALALSHKGHDVIGYDIDPARMQKDSFAHREIGPGGEPSIEDLLRESGIRSGSLDEVVAER